MIARALFLPVTALLVLAAGRPLSAQIADPSAPFVGLTVTRVAIEVEGRAQAPAELAPLVAVRPGQPLTREEWRTTLSRFAARFEEVSVLAQPDGAGVAVTFRLEPRHPIDRLELAGTTGIGEGDLRRLILARYGGVPGGRLDEVETTVERLLLNEGYQDAAVTASTVETHNPDRATLVLNVLAGPLTRIAAIEVSGLSPYTPDWVMSRAGLSVGDPWRPRETDIRVTAIEETLRSERYYEASASVSAVRRDDGRMDVRLVVDAGPLIVLRTEGDELPAPIEELVPIERNRSADVDLLEDARRRIEARLSAEGYRDANAPFTRVDEGDGSLLVITYTIDRGARYRVDAVVLPPDLVLPDATIRTAIGLEAGDPFSQDQLDAGWQQVVVAYQRLGYYEASGLASYQIDGTNDAGERLVTLLPSLREGPRGTVATVRFEYTGTSLVPEPALREVMRLQPGAPYVLGFGLSDVADLEQVYRDRGFRASLVTITPDIGGDAETIDLLVTVSEGQQVIVGDVLVVGHDQISEASVRETLAFEPGDPFGEAGLLESRRRLFELGIFRRVEITAQDALPGERVSTIVVSVEELPATTVGFGGGLEVGRRPRSATAEGVTDVLELSPRGFFEIGRRNLGGRNRSVSLFTRVALKPRTVDENDPDNTDTRRFGFTEYRLEGTFREQRAFRTDTNLLVSLTLDQAARTAFNFARQRVSAEALRRLSPRITFSARYGLEFSRLFDVGIPEEDRPVIDRVFPQVRLSTVSAGVLWDRRDDPVAPSRGTLATADLEVAVRALGSEVGYTKTFFQLSAFHPLRPSRRVVAAGRVQLGVARGLERVVPIVDGAGNEVVGVDGAPLTDRVADLPASQRFFAGGGASVRGFQIDRLGVPEILNPNGLSNGGNAVMVVNGELRTVVLQLFGRDLGAVGFVDAGNVFEKAGDLDLARLRTTLGVGVRYDSPIGPLRLDFGFKTDRLVIGGRRERGWEYHFSIGEAF